MRMYLRLLLVILLSSFRRQNLAITDESVLELTCMPWDCVLRYLGNDRFYAFMDLGRVDLLFRLGWARAVLKKKWNPFVVTSYIQYRCPVGMFQKVTVHTKLIYWDSRFFWMEHEIKQNDTTLASALSKNAARSRRGIVSTSLIFFILSESSDPPNCPESVRLIIELDAAYRQGNKTAS